VDQERFERLNLRADLICRKNDFNIMKMNYLTHFASHVQCFGSISMYSTKIGELSPKEQIKDGYIMLKENEATQQIFSQYGHQHALGMPLQTKEALLKTGVIVVGNSGMDTSTSSSCSAPQRMLKSRTNIGTHSEPCPAHDIEYCDMTEEMLCFIK